MKFSKGYALPMLLIIALGAIGFSYAWWTETLVIDDNVQTGELTVKFVDNGSQWGLGNNEIYFYAVAQYVTTDILLDSDPGQTLTVTIGNLYPSQTIQAKLRFAIINLGTIPAKFKSVTLTVTSGQDLADYIKTYYNINIYSPRNPVTGKRTLQYSHAEGDSGIGTIPLLQLGGKLNSKLQGKVLMPDGVFISGDIEGDGSIGFRLDADAPDSVEGKTITFTLTFVFEQWNAP